MPERARDLLLLGGASVYVVLLLMYRLGGQFGATSTVWAEDGRIFLGEAYQDASPQGWFRIYTGYLHVVPRALASVIVQLPPQQAAWWIAFLTSVLSAACLLVLAAGLRPWLPETWMRAALVVSVASAPAMTGEAGANLANWHWFASLGMVGLVLLQPRSWWTAGAAGVAALFCGLSDALVPAFAALAVLVLAVRLVLRTADVVKTLPVAAALLISAVVQQSAAALKDRGGPAYPPVGVGDMVDLYFRDVLAKRVTLFDLEPWMVAAQIVLVLALFGVAVAVGLRAQSREALLLRMVVAAGFVLASPVFLFVSVYVNHAYAERYAVIPAGLLITGIIVAVAGPVLVNRVLVGLVTVAMVGSVIVAGQVPYLNRTIGPDYGVEVSDARAACEAGATEVRVPTAPSRPLAPEDEGVWFVLLPCSELVDR